MSFVDTDTAAPSGLSDADSTQSSDLAELIQEALERADSPLTASAIVDQLKRHRKLKPIQVEEELRRLQAEGGVFEYAPYRGKSPRYARIAPLEYLRAGILNTATSTNKTKPEIRKSIGKAYGEWTTRQIDEQIDALSAEGKLKVWPPKKGGRSPSYSQMSVSAEAYVEAELASIVKSLQKKLSIAGISESDLWFAIHTKACEQMEATIDEPTVESVNEVQTPIETQTSPLPAVDVPKDIQGLILERIPIIEPRAFDGAVVLLSDLRSSLDFQLSKDEFDAAILGLASEYKISLSEQIRETVLDDLQREALVADADGRLYNALALRRSH